MIIVELVGGKWDGLRFPWVGRTPPVTLPVSKEDSLSSPAAGQDHLPNYIYRRRKKTKFTPHEDLLVLYDFTGLVEVME